MPLSALDPLPACPGACGPSGMRRSPDVSPRRLSDISPQLRQLKYLVVDEAIKEDLKWSRSVEDLTSGPVGLTSIEERILRITGYYGYQPWAASYKSKTPPFPRRHFPARWSCPCPSHSSSLKLKQQRPAPTLALPADWQLRTRGRETVFPDLGGPPSVLLRPSHAHAVLCVLIPFLWRCCNMEGTPGVADLENRTLQGIKAPWSWESEGVTGPWVNSTGYLENADLGRF